MKLIDYLRQKYKVDKPTTMTKVEAKAFGLQYPLAKGWLKYLGDMEINESVIKELQFKMERRVVKQKRKGKKGARHSQAAVDVLRLHRARTEFHPRKGLDVVSDAFLLSYEWRRVRMMALKKYGARCQCCGATPADGLKMNVDHIKPRKVFPELALDVNNLQVLCEECNHGKGNWDMTDWRHLKEIAEA